MEQLGKSSDTATGNEEISIRELILKVQDWLKYLWRKKFWIIGITLIGAAGGLFIALKAKPTYAAELTFVLEDNSSSPLGSYSGLASQLGIDLGGSGESSLFAGDNIMKFLKTRLIIEKALLSPVKYDGKEMTLVESYIAYNDLRTQWSKLSQPFNVTYPVHQDRKTFSLNQDSVLNFIQNKIVKSNLTVDKVDKKLSFISVKVESPVQLFSKYLAEAVVREALDFYSNTKIKRTKANVDRLQLQADSMKSLLDRKTYSTAAIQDLNVNPARQVANVGTELAMRDKMVLQTMYGEIVKNLELSKIAMAREMPVMQIIDTPILPLEKQQLGKLKGIIIGAFLGGFLTTLALLVARIYKEIMN
ncbi:Wzz/FepE/Etk N-terminal domain-containing protein [Chitinophaga nivalis]|uniref:Wzz/FepE/Etk N-terminal domain-containing protein n=1 Tax=Chitinophaga nivalis TaxID=2991709 RepID=A0ABT3IW63_9BACT|nr:Wzz/FepE/Etk N-terminal domain-containing protein [Chitinophaga nivalis]MCW3462085.1 Wzz/FepE/Etk N-terminal domain-containing protein [Chitinophaga nivalis]MCW3488223.1 Wzz/FepE/Etk N-terminal domain-containing protein [Chitinophaga nivalis]